MENKKSFQPCAAEQVQAYIDRLQAMIFPTGGADLLYAYIALIVLRNSIRPLLPFAPKIMPAARQQIPSTDRRRGLTYGKTKSDRRAGMPADSRPMPPRSSRAEKAGASFA